MMLRRVILSAGGTGGHIFPALAVAEELRQRRPEIKILFMGGSQGPEEELALKAGLDFAALPVRGFFGRGLKMLGAVPALARSIAAACVLIKRFRPEAALGFGGYASVPGLAAARLRGIPILIHEQNSVPGIANRFLARAARKVCVSLPDAAQWFPQGRCVLTGNPVRRSISLLNRRERRSVEEKRPRLLVLGGSQGAGALNAALLEDLPQLLEAGLDIRLQCGKANYAGLRAAAAAWPQERLRLEPFIEDMAEAYAWADLALCRAGATTLAELSAVGLPAIFVPFPHATHNHQLFNAEQARKVGAALLLEQKDLRPGSILKLCVETALNKDKLRAMSDAALLLSQPLAAAAVADETEKMLARGA